MRHINPQSTQVTSIFGTGYIPEQHADTVHHANLSTEHGAIGIAAVWSVFFVLVAANLIVTKLNAVSTMVLAGLQ